MKRSKGKNNVMDSAQVGGGRETVVDARQEGSFSGPVKKSGERE